MAIYVDAVTEYPASMIRDAHARRNGTRWSHLWTDTEAELVEFASWVGLDASWIQYAGTRRVHFDVTPSKRARAVALGAVQTTRREYLKLKGRRT